MNEALGWRIRCINLSQMSILKRVKNLSGSEINYIDQLNLEDYIGSYDPRDVIVLADSGYDNKKIENAIANKHWNFIIALGKTRSVKSEMLYLTTPQSRAWCHIATFFRNHRRLKWKTIRVMTNGAKRKRMEFRIRHTRLFAIIEAKR